jgi:hypothetical protein
MIFTMHISLSFIILFIIFIILRWLGQISIMGNRERRKENRVFDWD